MRFLAQGLIRHFPYIAVTPSIPGSPKAPTMLAAAFPSREVWSLALGSLLGAASALRRGPWPRQSPLPARQGLFSGRAASYRL